MTTRPEAALILRTMALGVATGSRSSLAVAGPVLSGAHGPGPRSAAALAVVAELVVDKLPGTPSRLEAPILVGRIAAGGLGGVLMARRARVRTLGPVVAAMVGAAAGSWAGAAWRSRADRRLPRWIAAVIEDGFALAIVAWACTGRSTSTRRWS